MPFNASGQKVETNWVGANHPWTVAGGAGFSHTCTIPVVQSWQSLALRGIRIHYVVAPTVVHDSHIYFQIQGHFFAISLGRRDKPRILKPLLNCFLASVGLKLNDHVDMEEAATVLFHMNLLCVSGLWCCLLVLPIFMATVCHITKHNHSLNRHPQANATCMKIKLNNGRQILQTSDVDATMFQRSLSCVQTRLQLLRRNIESQTRYCSPLYGVQISLGSLQIFSCATQQTTAMHFSLDSAMISRIHVAFWSMSSNEESSP